MLVIFMYSVIITIQFKFILSIDFILFFIFLLDFPLLFHIFL